jgi:hypothetical protein
VSIAAANAGSRNARLVFMDLISVGDEIRMMEKRVTSTGDKIQVMDKGVTISGDEVRVTRYW